MNNDSLSDGLEIGGWNISVYFEATGEKRSGYPIVVTSDPWTVDTDDDGLTDGQEFENATHPNHSDTDGDGMTDLWELTGPAPSDPCGIEGTPPNLSDLRVKTEEEWEVRWTGVGRLAIPMYVRVRNEINVTVTATDNVGLKWIRFHIDDKGEQKAYFTQSTNNSTVTMFFKHDLWSKWVSGYDLNITVSDVNGNEGYLEFHIDSALEAFVQWLIGAVTALAEFVMELASAAIDWIWEAIESIVERAIEPIDQFAQSWMDSVLKMMWLINFTSENPPSEERINNFSSILITPIFYTIFAVVIIFFMAINIISYFIPWIAWLLSAVYVLIISILTVYFLNEATTDEDLSVFDNAFLSSKSMTQDPMDYFLSFLKRDDDDGTRDNVENTTVKWLLCIGAVIYGLSGFIAAFLKDFYKLYLGGGWMVVSLFIQGCYYLIPSSHNIIRATFFFIEGFMFFISTFLNLKTWIEDKSLPIKFISAVSTGFSLIASAVNFALAARCLNQ